MATVNLNNNVSPINNTVKKGENDMKSVTLTKRGVGSATFFENGTVIVNGIEFEMTIENQKTAYRQFLAKGYTLKVNTESRKESPKVTKNPKENTPKEVKRYTWGKEGRKIWAIQADIYRKALIEGWKVNSLKGKEYHDARIKVEKTVKDLMKEHEERTYKLVNAIIANNQ